MCKVLVERPKDNVDFILYNHLFSRPDRDFTVDDIINEMRIYHLKLTKRDVQTEVNNMVRDGIVIRNVSSYTRVALA